MPLFHRVKITVMQTVSEADLSVATSKMEQLLIIVNGFHPAFNSYPKELHLRCCSSPRSASVYNNKYVITSKKMTNTEIFAFIVVLVFELLKCKVLFIKGTLMQI